MFSCVMLQRIAVSYILCCVYTGYKDLSQPIMHLFWFSVGLICSFKYDLDTSAICTLFDTTGVQAHDIQIIFTVHFMYLQHSS